MLIENHTVSFTPSMLFLSILIDKSSVCLLWRGLKTIKLDFLKLIDNLLVYSIRMKINPKTIIYSIRMKLAQNHSL